LDCLHLQICYLIRSIIAFLSSNQCLKLPISSYAIYLTLLIFSKKLNIKGAFLIFILSQKSFTKNHGIEFEIYERKKNKQWQRIKILNRDYLFAMRRLLVSTLIVFSYLNYFVETQEIP